MARLKVFFSHLTIEKRLAEILQEAVKRDFIGLVEFFVSSDTTSIPVGERWLERIVDGLKAADLHLVLCSPEAVKRPWITFEIGAACLRGVPIVPICHSGISPSQLPVPLNEFEAIQASDLDGLLKLYKRIASKIGSDIVDAKLRDLVSDIVAFETDYQRRISEAAACELPLTTVGVIASPRVLCVSSEQFLRLRDKDFQIIQRAYPEGVTHLQVLTSAGARDALMREHFDIVHVATYVCPKTGDLVFSEINTETGERLCQPQDFLTAEAFASLLKKTKASLVVIASCESFELAATLLTATNVVAPKDIASPEMFALWVENFYGVLPIQPLSEAFDFAVKASRAPMRLYAKQDLKASAAIKRPIAGAA
jgi:hypothetical protein